MSSLFNKQPSERLDYDIIYDAFFSDDDNDDIDSSGSVVATISGTGSAPDAELDGVFAIGTPSSRKVKVWVKGGVTGRTYKVTVKTTTHNGRVIETDFRVRVKEQ